MLLFAVTYKATLHWKGQKFNFQKKKKFSSQETQNIPPKKITRYNYYFCIKMFQNL